MTLVAAESGAEVGRMFEYQLALLLGAVDATSVTLFAEHCAQRAVDYAVKVSSLSLLSCHWSLVTCFNIRRRVISICLQSKYLEKLADGL